MSFDPLDSVGTCYIRAGSALPAASFIPCGNTALQNRACCKVGDFCLGSNACWGTDNETYVAGCTDLNYKDNTACPPKIYNDLYWVGIVLCSSSPNSAANSHLWAACFAAPCACTNTGLAITTAGTELPTIASLPAIAGLQIMYSITPAIVQNYISSTGAAAASSTVGLHTTIISTVTAALSQSTYTLSAVTTFDSLVTSTVTVSSLTTPNKKPLSTGAEAGIAVGTILAVLAIAASVLLLLKRRKSENTNYEGAYVAPFSDQESGNMTMHPTSRRI